MALRRWAAPALAPLEEIDRLFDTFLGRALGWRGFGVPPVDVYETDNEVVVKAHLPGCKKEDIEVTILDNVITIRAERKQEEEVSEEGYHRREITYGSIVRSVPLPVPVDEEKVTAKFEDGLLTVRAPKTQP
ncbi:MAG: Hsp20/alpha crystallin family protein, partial [Armatimonadetes bacterium]|nr:Hsp20/alpha crystallin family protein [Armatimonadota bacterium]